MRLWFRIFRYLCTASWHICIYIGRFYNLWGSCKHLSNLRKLQGQARRSLISAANNHHSNLSSHLDWSWQYGHAYICLSPNHIRGIFSGAIISWLKQIRPCPVKRINEELFWFSGQLIPILIVVSVHFVNFLDMPYKWEDASRHISEWMEPNAYDILNSRERGIFSTTALTWLDVCRL